MAAKINITERAQAQIRQWINTERYDNTWFIRFEAITGGCSGMRYHISIDNVPRNIDHQFSFEGFDLRCDKKSFSYLKEATLDFQMNLWQSTFKIQNPNAASTCCCGKSFLPLDHVGMEAA